MELARIRDIREELVLEVARGNVALWLAKGSKLADVENRQNFLQLPWLAIWTESTDPTWAKQLGDDWSRAGYPHNRRVSEVPNRLEEALGIHYSIAQICPVFYLNGRGNEWANLAERERRRARDEKIDEVLKLGPSVLLFSGFHTEDELHRIILDELPEVSTDLRLVISDATDQLIANVSKELAYRRPDLLRRTRSLQWSLSKLAEQSVNALAVRPALGPTVRIRNDLISIEALLQREGPIDQHFLVVTGADLEEPPSDITDSELVENFMAGRSLPWKALSRGALWRRLQTSPHLSDVIYDALRARRASGAAPVACLTIAAEQGAGLTTLLQEVAYHVAKVGYPSLIKRNEVVDFDYDALRTYLEYIQATPEGLQPALIVVDDSDSPSNQSVGITDLPLRLARDGRHLVFLRGVTIRSNEEFDESFRAEKRLPNPSRKVDELWFHSPLRERLTSEEVDSLCSWARLYWPKASADTLRNATQTWARDWESDIKLPPLLICLYILLRDNLQQPERLGRHIVSKIETLATELAEHTQRDKEAVDGARILTDEQLVVAVEMLKQSFQHGASPDPEQVKKLYRPTPDELAQVFVVLAMFGGLRVTISKQILASIMGMQTSRVDGAVEELKSIDLVSEFLNPTDELNGMLARDAYYTIPSAVGLRHPSFGYLALQFLTTEDLPSSLSGAHNWIKAVKDSYGTALPDTYPVRLLIPLFRQLRATSREVDFTAAIAQRLLRLQRVRGSHYHRWLFETSQADNLLEVLEEIPENVARQSSSILHTRGITRYKSCWRGRPIGECRIRYRKAADDLELAYDRSLDEHTGEAPAFVVTSLGLLYLGWDSQERDRFDEGGSLEEANRARDMATKYLREGLRLRPDNAYAAFGIATMLVEDCERLAKAATKKDEGSEYAASLAEAFEFLQYRPDATVAEEWEELHRRAVDLLEGQAAAAAIRELKGQGEDLWRALASLSVLRGKVPLEVTADPAEAEVLSEAWRTLGFSAAKGDRDSILSNRVRYAVFSAMPDRIKSPDYDRRFELIRRLDDSRFLNIPDLLFDYAMLACQTGNYELGERCFRKLRQGRRFLDVPLERSVTLVEPESQGATPLVVQLRVVKITESGRGWARVQEPESLDVTVPLSVGEFKAAGLQIHPGAVVTARIQIRPSGLFAGVWTPGDQRKR